MYIVGVLHLYITKITNVVVTFKTRLSGTNTIGVFNVVRTTMATTQRGDLKKFTFGNRTGGIAHSSSHLGREPRGRPMVHEKIGFLRLLCDHKQACGIKLGTKVDIATQVRAITPAPPTPTVNVGEVVPRRPPQPPPPPP